MISIIFKYMVDLMKVPSRWDIAPRFLEIDFQADDGNAVGMHKKTAFIQAAGAPAVLVIGRSPLSQH